MVISLCQLGFVFALIPSIRSRDKPALATCLVSVVLVCIISTSLLTLKLWFSAGTGFAIGVCWVILSYQKLKQP